MIELTVKTLDSQNHSFTVDDDITVAQFKEKIADTVNIPADTQRIIYCGRVLQDESKLNDYDVNGKVVHLVQRAPPSNNQRSRPATPPPHRRHFRGPEHGNAIYFGSMAIPSSLLDPQNVVLPLSPHSLSASRLNVARRMLRRATLVLNALDNPQNPEQPSQEEQQEEVTPVFEARVLVPTDPMDDVLSAVHNNLISAGAVPLGTSAQPVFLQEGLANQQETTTERNHLGVDDTGSPRARSISSTPGGVSPLANSIENLSEPTTAMDTTTEASDTTRVQGTEASQSGAGTSSGTPPTNRTENVLRTSEFAELLENMTAFQTRFAPYMERYIEFMRNDPAVLEENTRQTQAFVNRVSEVLHFLGHAYHSLSDIIVRVRTPPPRPLLCRPVVIQHPTVVQAGIPIQVEAQINISPDSTNNTSRSQTSQTSNSATSTNQQETNTVNRDILSSSTTTSGGNEPLASSSVLQPTVVGFPMFPGPTSMRVQTIPVEIRSLSSPRLIRSLSSPRLSLTLPRSNNNNNNNIPNLPVHTPTSNVTSSNNSAQEQTTNSTETATPVTAGVPSTTTASSTTSSAHGGLQGATFTIPGFHNDPNMEVFMEVTPGSITIDSMETTFVGGGQANELLQNAFQGPPSDILNSIWHMAGQLVNRGAQSTQSNVSNLTSSSTSTTAPSAPPTEQIDSATSTQTTSNLGSSVATTQNSQARGNTQTNPTTSTHTRSTSRPHVHLAQHAIQGFDPYLPCNSHHVVPWRRFQSSNVRQDNSAAASSGQNLQSGGTGTDRDNGGTPIYPVNNTIMNILQGIVNSIHTIYGRQAQQQPQAQQQQRTTANVPQATPPESGATGNAAQSAGDGLGQGAAAALNSLPFQLQQTFMPHLQNINFSDPNSSGPTIADLLRLFPESNVSEGENFFSDLINLLSRHLTVGDLIQLTNGRLEPWMRIRSSIRNFFLVRVMNGSCSSVAIDRGVNRILSEMEPLFDHLSALPTRDDIDLVRSAQSLFRARLPNIISLATSRSPNSLRMLVDQCLITSKQFGALILRASRNGQPGVEVVLDSIVAHHTRGIPREIQQWTIMTTRTQMRQFLSNLGVPDSVLQPYIVRKIDAVTSNVVAIAQNDQQEAMQVDEDDRNDSNGGASGSTEITSSSAINLEDRENDGEPLPTVVLGSEAWHNDVPADWVPIIARDAQRQRRQNSQAPFSDAYLSGMPSKRRKIVTAAKPRGSLSQVISESVRRAVTATGLASVAPLEVVAQGAGSDINIQSAYRELLRSNVRAGLRDNSDFTPERFPNATSYFNGPQ